MPDKADEHFVTIKVEKIESKNPTIICGFPGMGLIGNIVAQHLIDQFKMQQKGVVESRLFPPVAIVYGGLVKSPVRIYESAEKEIIVIFSDIPIDPIISGEVGRNLIEWARSLNPKEIIAIAGLATMGEERKVFGAAATPGDLARIKDDVKIFEIGTISGVPGVILNESLNNNIPAICMLGETRSANPDPRSAAEVVKALNKLYGWDVKIEPLLEQADEIEQMLHKLSEQIGEAEAKPSKDTTSIYG
jgi:uncharacterized protein